MIYGLWKRAIITWSDKGIFHREKLLLQDQSHNYMELKKDQEHTSSLTQPQRGIRHFFFFFKDQ